MMKNKELALQAIELEKQYLEHRDSISEFERNIILNTLKIVNEKLENENATN